MDTHILKLVEHYRSEYNLYEGLITSYPLHEVIRILKEKGYTVRGNYNDNTFSLKFQFNNDIDLALINYREIMQITNTCGYFCSNMKGERDNMFIIKKFNIEEFRDLIYNNLTLINFSFEAKYDIFIEKIPDALYHLTPTQNIVKILKNGLVPKYRSKKAYHPERIYFAKKPDDLTILFKDFYKNTKIDDWTILVIKTDWLPYLQIYKDPNFKEKGYYTLNTISPIAIKIYQQYKIK